MSGDRQRYMGLAEIAERLGVSRPRVEQLRQRPDFPEPAAKLAMGPIWLASQIERWVQKHRPQPNDEAEQR